MDIPNGCLAVYVGEQEKKRFAVPEAVEFFAESGGGDGCAGEESNGDETWLKKEEKAKMKTATVMIGRGAASGFWSRLLGVWTSQN
ncbi:unnamed protein product [Lactuca virosa]|uniref:Uncharacterized protein n=1 Tax=Lactuca virosa TaxID=75947 RepID=A0AAU9N0V0_9ASTR|nr:unnamed protein product [Lactuca virosa]